MPRYQHGRLRREIPPAYRSWVDIDWTTFDSIDPDPSAVAPGSLLTWSGKVSLVDDWEVERRTRAVDGLWSETITRLGQAGWEMVAPPVIRETPKSRDVVTSEELWFKRQLA